MKVRYLDPRCSEVEVKELDIGNTQVKYEYPKIQNQNQNQALLSHHITSKVGENLCCVNSALQLKNFSSLSQESGGT